MAGTYTPKTGDELLIPALARGLTQEQAAQEAGVSPRTVARRLADPQFRAAVQRARVDLLEGATGQLAGAAGRAVEVLAELAERADTDTVRLGAAKALVASILPLQERLDLIERIEAIERRLDESQKQAGKAGGPHGGIGR